MRDGVRYGDSVAAPQRYTFHCLTVTLTSSESLPPFPFPLVSIQTFPGTSKSFLLSTLALRTLWEDGRVDESMWRSAHMQHAV